MTWWLIGCSFQPTPLMEYRVRAALTSPDQFPVNLDEPTVFHAVDGKQHTAWSASAGDVGTFSVTGPVQFVELDTDAEWVSLRTFNGLVAYWEISDWQRVRVSAGRRVLVAEPQRLVEIRVEGDHQVREVRFLGREPDVYETTPRWVSYAPVNGEKVATSLENIVVGEVDLERCEAAPDRLPTYTHFRGHCERTEDGLRLDGEMNGQPLQRLVRFHQVGPCLALVDGWPMRNCVKRAPAR